MEKIVNNKYGDPIPDNQVCIDKEVYDQIVSILHRLAKKKAYSVREIQQVMEKLGVWKK